MAKTIAFLVLLLISPAAYAATHTVGDTRGWNSNVNYDTWASGKVFATGDTLLFNYNPSHSVDEVSAADYQSCNSANPIDSHTSSPTSIPLTAAGTRYFICPRSNHCAQGMKLTVTVSGGSTSPPSPPSGTTPSPPSGTTPSPPSGDGTPSPPSGSETPTTPRAPPPPAGGGESTLGGRNSLMVGSSIVLAAVFGLMG